ncbi:MAG TPA: PEP-CTERM sorting domain-containing protein [Rhizomicrobium sp.]|nr:PEP-CTERM sorting domain-containing protein [Rhizomicrobium sp.]
MVSKFVKLLMASTFLIGGASAAQAAAGFVALEGSDATALHHDGSYTPQLFKYLQGPSALPVLVYNPAGVIDLSGIDGGVATVDKTSLTGLTLSDYSAIYIESPGGCCSGDTTVLNGFGAAVSAFIAAGGNLSIENYRGGGYDGVVPGGGTPPGTMPAGVVEGVGALNGGVGSGPTCTDGETVNANGLARGFTQPPVDGCWSHQAYQNSYWLPLGYISLIDSDPSYVFGDGSHTGSSFLAFGGTLGAPTDVPEPLTLSLFSAGLVGAFSMRRKAKKA